MEPGYSFVSVSTAKPGQLDRLIEIASVPSEQMEGNVPGLLARQVGVDRERNAVVVWVAFDRKEALDDWLASAEGQESHKGGAAEGEMEAVIATFAMYDVTPVSQRF
jgi:heme-degrading monooxygenase HmoA